MRTSLKLEIKAFFLAILLAPSFRATAQTQNLSNTIDSRFADVEGTKLHYLTPAHAPAVILLHGYTQTSHMWRPLIPKLTKRFTVIAPDLPGIGDSAIPKDGMDMKTAAVRMHALVKSLGIDRAEGVGT